MKILLVEDEKRLADALVHLLKKNGYVVKSTGDGEEGLEMALTGVYELLILDRMLPKLDGLQILREFREAGLEAPVLFLTAKDTPKDRVEGLDLGADDYLVKPFSIEELLARIRALTRRKDKKLISKIISIADLLFDPLRCQVTRGKELIHLSVKESMLLELLVTNCGQVVTRERIFEKVWGYCSETEISNVDLYIHYLRKKTKTPYIKTVRGIGYCFEVQENVF